jgi:transposase
MQYDLSRLVGLEGFEVKLVQEEGDQLDLEVELVARAEWCPHCGGRELEVKERPIVRVRDLPITGRRTHLRWRKRRYLCGGCGRSHTESCPEIPPRQRATERFRRRLFWRTRSGGAHAEVAREEDTTRYQVGRAFSLGLGSALVERPPGPPRRLSLDEAAHRRRSRHLATIVSDLDRRAVHEVLDGHSRAVVERYLGSLSPAERRGIELVCIDPWEAYRLAVRAELPHARIVCDPFHLVRAANEALDTIRRSRQGVARAPTSRSGRRSRQRREVFGARHRLLRARERLSERQRRKLCDLFAEEPLIAEAWGLKEAFRAIYRAQTRPEAERRLDRFLAAVDRSGLQPFEACAKTVRAWREELLAYFDEPATNGYAEGVTNKVKVIKRRAYGLPTFNGFRDRVLLACG